MEKHHDFSPSSLPRRELCPGSYNAEKGLPEESGEYAIEGQLLHKAVADSLNFLTVESGLSAEQLDIVADCAEFGQDLTGHYECRHIEHFMECELFSGTVDVAAWMKDKSSGVIIDWKMGRGDVEDAIDNIQLAGYAYLMYCMYGVKSVTVYIKQPRIYKVTSYTFTDFESIRGYIEGVIFECLRVDAKRIPGVKQCKYCKAAGMPERCPESCQQVATVAALAPSVDNALMLFDAEKLIEIYTASKLVAGIEKKVTARIKEICRTEGSCGNLALIQTQGNREVKDISGMFQSVKDVIPQSEFLALCKCPIGKLEELFSSKVKERGICKTLKAGIEIFNEHNADFIGRTEPAEKLVERKNN